MTVQECSQRLEQLRWQIESKKERILALEALAENTSPTLTGMPHNPSKIKSKMAAAVESKIDLERSIQEDEAEVKSLKSRLAVAIEQIESPKYRSILYKRFFRGLSLEEISKEILYSFRSTQRLMSVAMEEIEKFFH